MPLYIAVRYLKNLAQYSINRAHVTNEYPRNYDPLNFMTYGKIFLGRVKDYSEHRSLSDSCVKEIVE
jgi:hypothetical protein